MVKNKMSKRAITNIYDEDSSYDSSSSDEEENVETGKFTRNGYHSKNMNVTDTYEKLINDYSGASHGYTILTGVAAENATKVIKIILRNLCTLFLENPDIKQPAIKYMHALFQENKDVKVVGFIETVSQLFTSASNNMLFGFYDHYKISNQMIARLEGIYELVKSERRVSEGAIGYRKALELMIFNATEGLRESKLAELKALIYMNIMKESTKNLERIHNYLSYLLDTASNFFEPPRSHGYELLVPTVTVSMIQTFGVLTRNDNTFRIIQMAENGIMADDDEEDDSEIQESKSRPVQIPIISTINLDLLINRQLDIMEDDE
jgi:hypothetical protein